jgi:acyl-CoA synthetase (AMP-forming)/AMP-acid ligase II
MSTPRLLEVFASMVDAAPEAPALIDAACAGRSAGVITRAELAHRSADMATQLRDLGVGTGDCVAVWLPNWSSYLAAHFAALAIGAYVVGVNTRYNVEEVAHVVRAARPRVVVVAHDFMGIDFAGMLRAALDGWSEVFPPTILVVSAPGVAPVCDTSSYDMGAGAASFPTQRRKKDTLSPSQQPGLAIVFTTSGSSGKPKLAAHNELGVSVHMLAVGEHVGLRRGHVMLGVLPLSGVFGYTACLASVLSGASVLLVPTFDARSVICDLLRHNVTHIVGADDLVGRIAAAWGHRRCKLPLIWMGIADFEGRSQQLAAWAEREFQTVVSGVYGSSELLALTAVWPNDQPLPMRWIAGGALVTSSMQVRIAKPGNAVALPIGQRGEMQFRGPSVVDAYLREDGVSAPVFTDDGWFGSGDLGRLIAPATVQYLCRMDDALRIGGYLVDPAEIEARLIAHPSVGRAKVVGIESPGGATVAVAFVEPRGSLSVSEAELRHWCALGLAKFKVPKRIYPISEMPTTPGTNGTKIRAAALRQMAQGAAVGGSATC